jgi:GTP cyclohydrolase I
MYEEIVAGLAEDPRSHLKVIFEQQHDEIVIARAIPLYSICEHHLMPFHGVAHVAYLPNEQGQVCGLSKLHRAVQGYARRPQVQERMTTQIADALEDVLNARGVMVVIEAEHLCVSMRGVRLPGSTMVTSAVRGQFRLSAASRAEVLDLIAARPR